jgi:beta-xylosidase
MTDTNAINCSFQKYPPLRNPDLVDGTYRNPILHADYSDPDAIRVGNDFWLTTSSFCCLPGLPILHSTDLVNWRIVNHALSSLTPLEHYRTHRAGCGVWAPALRYHAGRYWIFFPDPDFGIYVTTASHPADSWSEPFLLKSGKGLIDPCPLWDEDGRAYLIHAWAKSRSGIKNILTLQEMAADATALLGTSTVVVDGEQMPGWHTIEGPKLYKSRGYYWIFAPAGGVGEGYQAVFRSRSIWGPYEARIVLEQGNTPVNGPHQGAWVNTPAGKDWFLHFQEKLPYGRVLHLQPMQWTDEDWPVIGEYSPRASCGNPVLHHPKPATPKISSSEGPQSSDTFKNGRFGLQWQWQSNFDPSWLGDASLTSRKGLLLRCVSSGNPGSLWTAGNLLLQKITSPSLTFDTELHFHPGAPGDYAGLVVFGYDVFCLVLRKQAQGLFLELLHCADAEELLPATVLESIPHTYASIHLRGVFSQPDQLQFAWSTDGVHFHRFGTTFTVRESKWVGAKIGIFACTTPGNTGNGLADFSHFIVH